jgi:DUF4097 and DUF4098 domain-containing protein YvlB
MRRLTLVLFALAPAIAAADTQCKYIAHRDFDVDTAGLKAVAFALGSSDLVVEGVPGLAKVEVRGRACASEEAWLADLKIDQQRNGDRLTLTPQQGHPTNWHWFESSYAYIDLEVRVPASMAIAVKSSSGDAQVRNVATLDYDASSGDLSVDKIAGLLSLGVSSGDIRGREFGSVELRGASSGDATLRDVKGDIVVDHLGSGDLHFDNVGGGVKIGNVGSGDVTISHVDRDVSIDSIGSGDVNVSDVGGDFTVRRKGSGDVHSNGVRGKTDVPRDDD